DRRIKLPHVGKFACPNNEMNCPTIRPTIASSAESFRTERISVHAMYFILPRQGKTPKSTCPCFVEKCSRYLKRGETALSYGKDKQNPKWCRSKILIPNGKIACFRTITGENRVRQGETGSRRTAPSARIKSRT